MKRQSLVLFSTPSELQQWLEEELEDRSIDTVYAHTVFSILQQNCIDIDLRECRHFKNKLLKNSQKYEQPSFCSATKCKQQDFEKIKKKAAIDCLSSASDYVSDIEELIDEVLVRLKNIKNLKREKEEHTNNVDQESLFPFSILPSSPTDEIQKYFDAFPSLHEKLTRTKVHTKNDSVANDNGSFPFSKKCNIPIIPPLKKINAIYQNVEKEKFSDTSHDEQLLFFYKPITLPLKHLHLLQINTVFQCNYIKETLVESKFVILKFENSSKQENTKTLCNTFISFQKVLSKALLNCADCKDSVMPLHYKALQATDLQNKTPKTCGEKWLFYWGDKSIAKTWQIDFNYENFKNLDIPVSETLHELTKEIKEDGDELLKGLDSISSISEESAYYGKMQFCSENGIYPVANLYPCTSSNSDYEDISFTNTCFTNTCPATFNNDFLNNHQILSTIGRPTTKMLNSPLYQTFSVYEDSNLETDYITTDFSALLNFYETINSVGNYYEECGEWMDQENLMESLFTYSYESSCPVDDLNFRNTEYSEILYQNTTQCAIESDEHVIGRQNQTQLLKPITQKFSNRKPCLFFLNGNCTRSDCKFSHDFSTTTCRFWRVGTCYKGDTCPFLHGYPEEIDNDDHQFQPFLINEDEGNSYSLESEADFPSL